MDYKHFLVKPFLWITNIFFNGLKVNRLFKSNKVDYHRLQHRKSFFPDTISKFSKAQRTKLLVDYNVNENPDACL